MDRDDAVRNIALLEEGMRIVHAAESAGLTLRLLGGTAVLYHCEELRASGGSRPIADIDVIVPKGEGRNLTRLLGEMGYQPEARFNALHGDTRVLFHGPLGPLDGLIGDFAMCHRLNLHSRLELDSPTLTVSDLLLTKLQIVQLNEKDRSDALDLIGTHEIAPAEGDVLNVSYIGQVTAQSWGLWRTVNGTLEDLERAGGARW